MSIAELYDTYADKVYNFFYIKSFDRTVAEDLTSQTFMIVVEKLSDPEYVVQDGGKFVYGVMRNMWLQHLQRSYRRQERTVEDMDDFASYVTDSIEDYESMTVKQRAEVFINMLPDKQRDIVALRLLHECSIVDICGQTGKDTNYVKTTYKRGLKRLKAVIADHAATTSFTRSQEEV